MERRSFAQFGISVGAIAIAAVIYGSAARADEYSQILYGYKIIWEIFPKTTKLDFAGKDWALVGLGSYLVNSTGCNDCHTHPNWATGGNPFKGEPEQINTDYYLSGGRVFLKADGTVLATSANITPDKNKNGLPAGLTWDAFREVMRTGQDPDTGDLLQVMPWPLYRWKTDRDLRAMYEYLRVIPHREKNPMPGP